MTPKQKTFVDEYLLDLNATRAAIRAGYSPRTAEQQGYRLLRNVQVANAVKAAQAARADRTRKHSDWVLNQLVENHEAARASGQLSQSNRALELIGRHIGMFTDKKGCHSQIIIEVARHQESSVGKTAV